MNEVRIEKLDNYGRGICYINNKITFVNNALPEEVVNIKLTKENKKYNEAEVVKYIKTSPKRIKVSCPYFNICGGCNLSNLTYDDSLSFKKDKLENIVRKYGQIDTDIEIIPSNNTFYYRNKITLKVVESKYGYYESSTHNLVEIADCLLAEDAIRKFLKDIKYLNIKNGEVIIRSNFNNELIIWIKTEDKLNISIEHIKKNHKIVGVIINDKTIYGDSSFVEKINNLFFKVSYDSFFQINRDICSKLFNLIKDEISSNETLLDLYCGVGTLGINASDNTNKVYGIEIIKNAILNAITNATINNKQNMFYMLGDVGKCLSQIKDKVDVVIVDPPRAGLDNKTKNILLELKPKKIIYVSCDPMTFARDIKELNSSYKPTIIKGLDMFPFTHHIETFCVMEKK